MKLGTMIIGGKADGGRYPARVPRMEADGDTYMLCMFREQGKKYYFFQSAGMTPVEALKIFKVRSGLAKIDMETPK